MRRPALLLLLLLAVACAPKQPLIGISCSRYGSTTILPTTYTDAIAKAGGVPLIIPTIGSEEQAAAIMDKLDGILFSGGEDVGPDHYGEEVWNETVEVDTLRDGSDILLARAALDRKKPILAICRGSQLMNVVLGGSLYQDIPSQLPGSVRHGGSSHKIAAEPGSVLHGLYGGDSLTVNSYHHQCVKETGRGVTVTARSADGIVEAWEAPGIIAVQFHPEKSLDSGDAKWLPLFRLFVERTGRR